MSSEKTNIFTIYPNELWLNNNGVVELGLSLCVSSWFYISIIKISVNSLALIVEKDQWQEYTKEKQYTIQVPFIFLANCPSVSLLSTTSLDEVSLVFIMSG